MQNDCIIIFPILLFWRNKICKITREMSRAQVNNCYFPYQTVFKNDSWRVYGVLQAEQK